MEIESSIKEGEVTLDILKDGAYIDRSAFIKKFIDDPGKVILWTRPRRFLKTSNLKLLQYFFSSKVGDLETKKLFNDMEIKNLVNNKNENIVDKHQGRHQVVWLSLHDVSGNNFEEIYQGVYNNIQILFLEFSQLLKDSMEAFKALFSPIISRQANKQQLEQSLKVLVFVLHRVYQQKVVVLIDEYDAPLTKLSYRCPSENFKKEAQETLSFLKNLLTSVLKDNQDLFKGGITGVVQIPPSEIFSGLNIVKASTLLSPNGYEKFFGFTKEEVEYLHQATKSQLEMDLLEFWYNGYRIGECSIYCPWSIIRALNTDNVTVHWTLTGNDQMISDVLKVLYRVQKEALIKLLLKQNFE